MRHTMPSNFELRPLTVKFTATLAALFAASAFAQADKPSDKPSDKPNNEQVIVPQVERREVKLPRYPSNDFSISLFGGTYATQNFGATAGTGLRAGYHITEDVFVEATFGRSKVTDSAFRQIFPNGGILPTPTQTLSYYDVVAGYNVLPGEVFFGRNNARASQGYIVAGVGSTKFADQKRQTIVAGFGLRLLINDHFAVQADVRDHIFSLDLLGKRQSTQNLEITAGLTLFF